MAENRSMESTHRRVHKPSLGPYTFDNPEVSLNCGKWLRDVPIDEPCEPQTTNREARFIAVVNGMSEPEQRSISEHVEHIYRCAIAEERERCAKRVERFFAPCSGGLERRYGRDLASHIREGT